jgi:hypothetical protein
MFGGVSCPLKLVLYWKPPFLSLMAHPVAEETFLLLEKGDLLQLSNNNMKVKQKINKEYILIFFIFYG